MELLERYTLGLMTSEEFELEISDLPNSDRKELRERMLSMGLSYPQNLNYNYQTQTWID